MVFAIILILLLAVALNGWCSKLEARILRLENKP